VGRSLRLARKELREVLRDRRTIITLVLMPLLVYPLLGVVLRKGLLSNLTAIGKIEYRVCLLTEDDALMFSRAMQRGQSILTEFQSQSETAEEISPIDRLMTEDSSQAPEFEIMWPSGDDVTSEEVRHQTEEGYADLGILLTARNIDGDTVRADPGDPRPLFIEWELIRRTNSRISNQAFDVVATRLGAINDRFTEQLLVRNRLPTDKPATVIDTAISGKGSGGYSLVTFIPLVLVLMTMTGAVYPAIDVTAGERERGTMEILMAAPVSRLTLLGGKFLAVLVVALLTATANLLSMLTTLYSLGLDAAILGNTGWTVIPMMFALMIVFAAFFSAVLLSLTSIARSFKEAQAYLIPLMLVSLTPGVFSLMPNLQMNLLLAVTPLANAVLLARDLLQGHIDPLMFAIVLISTAIYGLLALSLAARIFGSNAVLYGSAGTWSELFRRPDQKAEVVSIPMVLTALALVFPLFLTANTLPGRLDISMTSRFAVSGAVAVIIFVLVPVLVTVAANARRQTAFAVHSASPVMFVGCLLLGLSLWTFIYEINLFMFGSHQVEVLEKLHKQLAIDLNNVSLATKLLCLALIPAATEEFFFRGFVQNSLQRKLAPWTAVVASAVLFGMFHVIVRDALFIERFIPSTLMGLVLGTVFQRSGSVLPGMLLHVVHNGLLISIGHFESQLKALGIGTAEREHLPISWLIAACVPIAVACWLLRSQRRSLPEPHPA
jgi:membrane protease YdiL (CAAX protease family)/ABC-type multidrug transport system permease subunit